MSMRMEICVFLAYAAGMLMIYIAGRFLLVPLKWTGRLLANSIAGGLIIVLINFVCANRDFLLPLNPITALTAGILGVPGIVLMAVLLG